MRAAGGSPPGPRRMPRLLRWLLWLAVGVLGSVLVGFLMGLARPRVKAPT